MAQSEEKHNDDWEEHRIMITNLYMGGKPLREVMEIMETHGFKKT